MIWKKGCNLHNAVWNWQSKSWIMQKPLSQNVPCLLNSCLMQSTVWGNLHHTLACRNHPYPTPWSSQEQKNNKIICFQRQSYSWDSNLSWCWMEPLCWRAVQLHIQIALCSFFVSVLFPLLPFDCSAGNMVPWIPEIQFTYKPGDLCLILDLAKWLWHCWTNQLYFPWKSCHLSAVN